MSIHTSGLVPRRLFSSRCELVPSTSVSCRPRQGVGYSLKWQGQGIGCKPVGATHVVGLWRVRARGRGRSVESPLAGLGELPNSRSRRPASDFPFRGSSAESMGRKLRSIDGGGLSSLACRSLGPARSTREKVADVHCGIGSWRGDRRRRVLVLAILKARRRAIAALPGRLRANRSRALGRPRWSWETRRFAVPLAIIDACRMTSPQHSTRLSQGQAAGHVSRSLVAVVRALSSGRAPQDSWSSLSTIPRHR